MDCIVHGVAKSRTRLSDFQFHFQTRPSLPGLSPMEGTAGPPTNQEPRRGPCRRQLCRCRDLGCPTSRTERNKRLVVQVTLCVMCYCSSPTSQGRCKINTPPKFPDSTPFSQPISHSLVQAPMSPVPFPAGVCTKLRAHGPLLPQQQISTKLLLSPRGHKEWTGLK